MPRIGPELPAQFEREHLHQACITLARSGRRDLEEARGAEERRAWLAPRGGHAAQGREAGTCRDGRNPAREPVREVALVARERLVAAVTGERDRHVAPRLLGDQEGRERGLVPERLVVRGGEPRQRRRDVLLDRELLVHGPVALAARARVRAL